MYTAVTFYKQKPTDLCDFFNQVLEFSDVASRDRAVVLMAHS